VGASSLSTGARWASLPRQFRFWVVLCVLGVMVWFLLNALEREASRVQETANTLMLNQLRAALVVKAAEVRLSNEGRYEDWVGTNPMALLRLAPQGYEGDCGDRVLRPGQWCFKVSGRSAVNRPIGTLIFQSGQPITEELQKVTKNQVLMWQVVIDYIDKNSNGRLDSKDLPIGLKLSRVGKHPDILEPNEFEGATK